MFECYDCGEYFMCKVMELNADYQPVCPGCYLKNVPDVDVAGRFHDRELPLVQ